MKPQLLALLVCPVCKGSLYYDPREKELLCKRDRLAYPILDHIPVLLVESARRLSLEEYDQLS